MESIRIKTQDMTAFRKHNAHDVKDDFLLYMPLAYKGICGRNKETPLSVIHGKLRGYQRRNRFLGSCTGS